MFYHYLHRKNSFSSLIFEYQVFISISGFEFKWRWQQLSTWSVVISFIISVGDL